MELLKRMRYLYMLIQKALLNLQDILMKEKEYSIESSAQYTIPAFWDGNPKLLMVFTIGKKDCWKETRDFSLLLFFFFIFPYCLNFSLVPFFGFVVLNYRVCGQRRHEPFFLIHLFTCLYCLKLINIIKIFL